MAAGCAKVFKEKVSGVTWLDRLARSTRDLLNVLAAVGERDAGFRSLKDAWVDTTTPHGRLMLSVASQSSSESLSAPVPARTASARRIGA
jgi:DNA invertase Pin-like site-specific DNA recombinase